MLRVDVDVDVSDDCRNEQRPMIVIVIVAVHHITASYKREHYVGFVMQMYHRRLMK